MNDFYEFKKAHERFTKALKYIVENTEKLKQDPERWKKVKANFKQKFEIPLDEAWKKLPAEDKERYYSLYISKRTAQDETVQKVLKEFGGKVVKHEFSE